MGTKFYLDPEFKKLQKEWNKKLKASGFEDIENISPEHQSIRTPHSHYFFSRYTPEQIEETLNYYSECMHFYWHYTEFKSKREKEMWFLYSQGMTRRKIADDMKSRGFKVCHNLVQYYVGRLKKIMHNGNWPSSETGEYADYIEEKSDLF